MSQWVTVPLIWEPPVEADVDGLAPVGELVLVGVCVPLHPASAAMETPAAPPRSSLRLIGGLKTMRDPFVAIDALNV